MGMRAEQLCPELARSRDKKGNGVTEDWHSVRHCRRGPRPRGLIRGGSVMLESTAVTECRVEAYGRQDAGYDKARRDHDQD